MRFIDEEDSVEGYVCVYTHHLILMCWTPPLYMQYRLYGHMSVLYVTYVCNITEWNHSIRDTLGP